MPAVAIWYGVQIISAINRREMTFAQTLMRTPDGKMMKGERTRRQDLEVLTIPRARRQVKIEGVQESLRMVAIQRLAVAVLWTLCVAAYAEESALHQAVEKGDRTLVERLLKDHADPNARTASGETPLHYAAFPRDAWFAGRPLGAGADPRVTNSAGETPLFWAALEGNVTVVRVLLARGANANVRNAKGNLPLHAAANNGELELVRLLLPRTKQPPAKNREGRTARDYALASGHDDIAHVLAPRR